MNRKQLAAEIDHLDRQVEALQIDKRETFAAYREANGKAECKAAQAAIKLRQKFAAGKRDEIEEHDALVFEILAEITDNAPRATRSNDRANREAA